MIRTYIAEFFGTLVLTLVVTASIFSAAGVPTSMWVGLALTMLILTIGAISGGHYNPAVTVGMMAMKKVSMKNGIIYIVAQLLAGLAAWGIAMAMALQLPQFNASFTATSFAAEAIGMAIFAFGIAGALDKSRSTLQSAAMIGLSLIIGSYVAGGFGSYGIINPAIAFGVHVWGISYLVGPLVGSIIGMFVYRLVGEAKR